MKIIVISPMFYPIIGGGEKQAQKLASGLIKKGHDVVVITKKIVQNTESFEIIDNIPVHRITYHKFLKNFAPIVFMIYSFFLILIKYKEYKIVHFELLTFECFLSFFLKFIGKKIVIRIGSTLDINKISNQRFGNRILESIFTNTSLFLPISNHVKDYLVDHKLDKNKIAMIHNIVEIKEIKQDIKIKQKLKKIAHDRKIVITTNQPKPYKGLGDLLKAIKIVSLKRNDVFFLFLGDGIYKEKLIEESNELGIDDDLRFLGNVYNVEPYLYDADIFVIPSISEGLSCALMEAMGMELPSVVTDCGGVSDLIEDGVNGLIVPIKNPPLLAEKIEYLLDNPLYAVKLGKAAKETIYAKFDKNDILDKFIQEYNKLYNKIE